MREAAKLLLEKISKIAPTPARVLIVGGHRVSRELTAHMIHRGSARSAKPMLFIDCEGLPSENQGQALIDELAPANGGTVFLERVDALNPSAQNALLDTMKTGVVSTSHGQRPVVIDVRILAGMIKELGFPGSEQFSEELYYRLSVVTLQIPVSVNEVEGGPPATPLFIQATTFEEFKQKAEREFLRTKLMELDWNVSETARVLQMPRSNLYKKIERYSLSRDEV